MKFVWSFFFFKWRSKYFLLGVAKFKSACGTKLAIGFLVFFSTCRSRVNRAYYNIQSVVVYWERALSSLGYNVTICHFFIDFDLLVLCRSRYVNKVGTQGKKRLMRIYCTSWKRPLFAEARKGNKKRTVQCIVVHYRVIHGKVSWSKQILEWYLIHTYILKLIMLPRFIEFGINI